jgi:outer membrane protein OmpA-like peptidoglycan-associated protein
MMKPDKHNRCLAFMLPKLLLGTAVLILTQHLSAQRDLYNWQINGQAGVAVISDQVEFPKDLSAYSSGLRIERRMGEAWSIGLHFLHLEVDENPDKSFSYSGLSLGFHWDNGFMLSDRARVAPFHRLQIGYGYEGGGERTSRRKGNTLGLENGVKVRLGYRFSADAAMEILAPQGSVSISDILTQDHYTIWKVGLSYHFGRRKSTYTGPVFRAGTHASKNEMEFVPFAENQYSADQTSWVDALKPDTVQAMESEVEVWSAFQETTSEDTLLEAKSEEGLTDSIVDQRVAEKIKTTQEEERTKKTAALLAPVDSAVTVQKTQMKATESRKAQEISRGSEDSGSNTRTKEKTAAAAVAGSASGANQSEQETSVEEGVQSFSATSAPAPTAATTTKTTQNTTVLPPAVVTNTREVQSPELVEQNRRLAEQNALLIAAAAAGGAAAASAQPSKTDSLEKALKELQEKYDLLLTQLAHEKLDSLFAPVDSDWTMAVPTEIDTALTPLPIDSLALGERIDTAYIEVETIQETAISASLPDDQLEEPEPIILATYPITINFALNRDVSAPEALKGLDVVAQDLKNFPDKKALLTSYTDKSGSAAYNLDISKRRANGIKNYLVQKGANPDQIEINPQGSQNATEKFNPDLRRVEIRLIPTP